MLKRRLLALFLILCLGLGACGESAAPETTVDPNALSVSLRETIPNAYVGVSYDLEKIVIAEEDVDYSYKATYVDPDSGETKKLTVKSGKFSPKVAADITVVITAEKGKESATKEVVIPIGLTADALDNLLASSGAAGAADSGVNKKVITDPSFIKADGSISALEIDFANTNAQGTTILTLSHHSLMAYYSSRVWKNAAVTCWVYNPMDQDVSFKLSSYNPETLKSLFWDSADNTQTQVVKSGEWSRINFSLYQMGIEQVLFDAPDGVRDDKLLLQAQYAGSDNAKIYIDGIDIVEAEEIPGLETGYVKPVAPEGNYTDLLSIYPVYTDNEDAVLSKSDFGNGSKDSICIGSKEAIGYPTFSFDFPEVTDISGFNYLKMDVYAEKCYPWASVAVRYLDENGEEKIYGTSYDFYREQWRTLYLNLDYLKEADLTRVVGMNFSVNIGSRIVENAFNCVYFDNVTLYSHPTFQPEIQPATLEDHDLISGPMYPSNIKPGTNGVCKVACDETGTTKSNSTLMFWTNNACGYPNVYTTFMFDEEQDWSDYSVFSYDTHQSNAHYWMCFTIHTLTEDGVRKDVKMYNDTVLTHWMTNSAPFAWFKNEDGSKPDLSRVIGLSISVDMAVNVTDEVGYIFFDNIYVS